MDLVIFVLFLEFFSGSQKGRGSLLQQTNRSSNPTHNPQTDPDPNQSQKPDPHTHQTQNSGDVEAQNEARAHNGGLDFQSGTVDVCRPVVADLHHCDEDPDPESIKVNSWIRIRNKVTRGIRIRITVFRIRNIVFRNERT